MTIEIISRKYDGRISKSWHAELAETRPDHVVVRGVFGEDVDHRKLGFIKRGTISIEYYWPDRWYNVFRFLEPDGSLRNFYCNVTMPPAISASTIDYVDLDIDLLADAMLDFEILDLDEFAERSVTLSYPSDVIANAHRSIDDLVKMVESRQYPFDLSRLDPQDIAADSQVHSRL
jgi:protein associated with RNAse G/E